MKDALSQPGNLSLDPQMSWGDPFSVDDEYCHAHSERLREAASACDKQDRDRTSVQEFVDLVRRGDPDASPAIEAFIVTGTQRAAGDLLGMTESRFTQTRNRLRELGKCFLSGNPAPRQRKPYQRRVKVEPVLSFATAA